MQQDFVPQRQLHDTLKQSVALIIYNHDPLVLYFFPHPALLLLHSCRHFASFCSVPFCGGFLFLFSLTPGSSFGGSHHFKQIPLFIPLWGSFVLTSAQEEDSTHSSTCKPSGRDVCLHVAVEAHFLFRFLQNKFLKQLVAILLGLSFLDSTSKTFCHFSVFFVKHELQLFLQLFLVGPIVQPFSKQCGVIERIWALQLDLGLNVSNGTHQWSDPSPSA